MHDHGRVPIVSKMPLLYSGSAPVKASKILRSRRASIENKRGHDYTGSPIINHGNPAYGFLQRACGESSFWMWVYAIHRKREEVLVAFDQAIALAEQEEEKSLV